MLTQLLSVAAPVFGIALVGYLFAGWRAVDLRSITDLVLYVTAPALVFASLAGRAIDPAEMLGVGGGAVFQSLVCGALAWIVFRAARVRGRGLLLATMFPNTGNLGLPLALFAFGDEGLAAAALVFVAITLVHYSLGIAIVSGTLHPGAPLRTPLLYAAVLGITASLAGVSLPDPLLRGVRLLGEAAVPLMLISLGVRMRSVRVGLPWHALLAVALRLGPGLVAAWLWVDFFDLQGAARGVVLVTGVLPSAVMNFVLAEAHDQQSEEVAQAIFLGTIASFFAIPAVLGFLV